MASPPLRDELAGNPTNAEFKLGIGKLWDYVTSLLGNASTVALDSEKKLARENLGIGAFGFKNKFLNPQFSVAQEFAGNLVTIATGGAIKYVIDGWYASASGANATAQLISGISDKRFSFRLAGSAGNTSIEFGQRIESLNCTDLKNQDVTVSFKAKASNVKTITWNAFYANSENNFLSKTNIAAGTIDITTVTTDFNFVFNAGSNAQNGIAIEFSMGAMNIGETIDFDSLQLEKSTKQTEFEIRDVQHEILCCQRYWQNGSSRFDGYVFSGINYSVPVCFFAPMRTIPTVVQNNVSNTSVSATTAVDNLSNMSFCNVRTATATGAAAFITSWTASARI